MELLLAAGNEHHEIFPKVLSKPLSQGPNLQFIFRRLLKRALDHKRSEEHPGLEGPYERDDV